MKAREQRLVSCIAFHISSSKLISLTDFAAVFNVFKDGYQRRRGSYKLRYEIRGLGRCRLTADEAAERALFPTTAGAQER